MDTVNDKIKNKNQLFTNAIPNCVIPTSVNGHELYVCTDCGDKFIFESSYNDHIHRKSAKITYLCRVCNLQTVFYNRCNFLFHIRSHSFKTATINVSDLKVEPLSANFIKAKPTAPNVSSSQQAIVKTKSRATICFECKTDITLTGVAYKDRVTHLKQYSSEVYTCPVCLFPSPSICGLKLHLRLHLKCPPYYCPECGINLANENVQYPYNHDCNGFNMMRATASVNCSVPGCSLFNPKAYKEHMAKYTNNKKVYICPICVVVADSLNEAIMGKHLMEHKTGVKPLLFYQCDLSSDQCVLETPKLNNHHLKIHINTTIFPCWVCWSTFKEISGLLTHFIMTHNKIEIVGTAINAILKDSTMQTNKPERINRVIKRCMQCKRSFTYECEYEEISVSPNECPFNCKDNMEANITAENMQNNEENCIICPHCYNKVSQEWDKIKKHYAELHKTHKCLDVEISLPRLDIKKYLSQKKIANRPRQHVKILKKTLKRASQRYLVKPSINKNR